MKIARIDRIAAAATMAAVVDVEIAETRFAASSGNSTANLLSSQTVFSFCGAAPVGTMAGMGITPQQFKQIEQRLSRPPRAASPVFEAGSRREMSTHQIILGLDPSLRGTGYGVIRLARPYPLTLIHGTISNPPAWERSRCLVHIVRHLRDVLKQYHPTVCVVEGVFYVQNLQTALVMSEARGAALAVIAEAGLDIFEVAPRKVKQAIVGYGAAQKTAVARMVQRLLHLAQPPEPDAADALALALAHAQEQGRYTLTAPRRI